MRVISICLLVLSLTSLDTTAQESAWLPPDVAENLARQLADRMQQTDLGPAADEEKLLDGTRRMIAAMRADLDTRGEEGIAELAPTFSGIELPEAGQRELDLMARYNVCNLVLFRQLQDPAFRADVNARITSTLGLTALTMVIGFLRESFVAKGNDVTQIEAHLTDPRLQPIFDRIQKDLELRGSVEQACRPVVTTLLEKPLAELGH
jgi:hypothetical protein